MDASNIKPAQLIDAARPADAAAVAGGAPSAPPTRRLAAGNLSADESAGGNLLDALKESQDRLKTVMTGVENQATVQTMLQVQAGVQGECILPDLLATLNKQAAQERQAAIVKV